MRKKLNGFTLIELIIVMAILAIMMAAIMKFFEPIRMVYNDATYYEQRRTVTNSMVKYTTESIRYAKYIGIYNQNEVGARGANSEANALAAASMFQTSMGGSSMIPATATVNVIELNYFNDYTEGLYNNKAYFGRLYRTKFTGPIAPGLAADNSHLAFGANYYNANNYNMQWAYEAGKFEAYASSYNADDGLNADGIVVRSVAAVVLKNVNLSGAVYFTDGPAAADVDGFPDILAGPKSALSTLKTTGTNIPYGMMNVGTGGAGNAYYLVWIDADQF
jgi:prepilin-type N-terminal cleavage/methylation domain-containing protein